MTTATGHQPDAAPPPAATAKPGAIVDGWPINIATPADALKSILAAAAEKQSFCCFTLNLDHLVKLRESETFRRAYRNARFVTADGAPVARIARRQWPEVVRTTGADLFEPLCEAAARQGIPVYLSLIHI